MILKLQKSILNRPVTTTMVYLALAIFGIISLSEIKINLLPNLEFPRVTIITSYPNSAPEEVENLVTKPITETVGTINGLERIDSESIEGYSFITIQFKNDKNINYALMELRERIDLIRDILPQSSGKPIITRYDPASAPIAEIVFFPNNPTISNNLRPYILENVKVYLDRIDGVAAIQFAGGDKKEILVDIDPIRLYSYGLSILDLEKFLEMNNKNFPAGQLPIGEKDLLIRAMGEFRSLDEIGDTIVGAGKKGEAIYLKDFSNISETFKKRTGIARYNGKDCVVAYIYKESNKNTVEITKELEAEIQQIQSRFQTDLNIEIVYKEATFIQASVSNLFSNLIIGTSLAFIALLLILRNFKSPFILLFVIPATLFPTFIFFKFFNLTLNMMSLGGLALGIGMLFDNSNVVLSGIERNIKLHPENIKEAILKGVHEVTASIFSATMTTVIVFLPISFIKSIIGLVFAEMALSIVVSILVSLTVALTLIPLLAFFFFQNHEPVTSQNPVFRRVESWEIGMEKKYINRLSNLLENPGGFIFAILMLFFFSLFLISKIHKEFVPVVDTGEFRIEVQTPRGFSLETTSNIVSEIENILKKEDGVKSILTNVGYDSDSLAGRSGKNASTNIGIVRVQLKDNVKYTTREFISGFRSKVVMDENVKIRYKPGGDIISTILSQKSGEFEFLILGDNLEELTVLGEKITNQIGKISGVKDIRTSMEEKSPELKISYDKIKLAKFGLNNSYLSDFLKTASDGSVVTKMKLGGYDTDIRLRFMKQYTNVKDDILKLKIRTSMGENIELSQFAYLREQINLNSIIRRGNSRVNLITANLENISKESEEKLDSVIANMKLPPGYSIQFSGDRESMDKSIGELLLSFALTTALIYMLLSGQFESLKYSFIMICTIPLIFIGSSPALLLSNKSLNVSSFMGLILLVGIVVDNASLFFEYFKLNLSEGLNKKDAIVKSGSIVLKPILMNNSTTILGLLPVVIGIGKGGEFQAPLGVVVISGLLSSVFLTLFLIPILFFLFSKEGNSTIEKVN